MQRRQCSFGPQKARRQRRGSETSGEPCRRRRRRRRRPSVVFVNELHYDNAGADADEFVEVAGTAGTPLDGWSLVRYNGNMGTTARRTGPPLSLGRFRTKVVPAGARLQNFTL